MERLQFSTTIHAPRERVWKTLWGKDTYAEWTSPITQNGSIQTDWKKGSSVLFLDKQGYGMVSEIADLKPNEFVSFKHEGMLKDGEAETAVAIAEGWYGARENYSLRSIEDMTEVIIEHDVTEENKARFMELWPKALQRLKEMCEDTAEAAVADNIHARGLS